MAQVHRRPGARQKQRTGEGWAAESRRREDTRRKWAEPRAATPWGTASAAERRHQGTLRQKGPNLL